MHSFARFGIEHLSPSSLNLWRSAPGVWALRYLGKIKNDGSPAMWRGSAVENGLEFILRGQSMQQALAAAYQSFTTNAQNYAGDPKELEAERALIAPMLATLARWSAPSMLNATQQRVEYFFDPVPIPVIGWLDFAFEGEDVDLKTTKACPSKPRDDHVRQVSLYRASRQRRGRVLYVTDKRHAEYAVTDDMMNESIAELHADALSLNNLLARCETKEDVLRSLPIDWDHWQAPKKKVPLSDILSGG